MDPVSDPWHYVLCEGTDFWLDDCWELNYCTIEKCNTMIRVSLVIHKSCVLCYIEDFPCPIPSSTIYCTLLSMMKGFTCCHVSQIQWTCSWMSDPMFLHEITWMSVLQIVLPVILMEALKGLHWFSTLTTLPPPKASFQINKYLWFTNTDPDTLLHVIICEKLQL